MFLISHKRLHYDVFEVNFIVDFYKLILIIILLLKNQKLFTLKNVINDYFMILPIIDVFDTIQKKIMDT